MATRKLVVEVIGDTSNVERALGKTGKEADNLNSRFGGLAKTAGKAGVAGAIVGLGFAVKAGISEFSDAQKVTAQTNAVLKSTGGVANVSRQEIEKLSGSLLRKSGVDDEAIQSGANLLLTFTKVRNEVGAGNDIFNQATKATLDLSVALGKDMQSSAILVGKALNDPIKGMGALSRAGVQFDEQQKTTIKTLVATGDTLGAQKIILKELETQFAGSAEAAGKTFAGQLSIAREEALNFAGGLVERSIPALNNMAKFISDDVIPVLRRFHAWFKDNINPVIARLREIAENTWKGIAAVLKDNEQEINRILNGVETAARAIGTVLLWILNNVWIPYLKVMFEKAIPVALGLTIDAFSLLFRAIDKTVDVLTWIGKNGGAAITTFWGVAKKPLDLLADAFGRIASVITDIVDAVKWLADHAGGAIGKVAGAVGAIAGRFGDGGGASIGPVLGGIDLKGARPEMLPFAIAAQQLGLRVSSGLRPGAMTKNGTPSDHGVGKALDLVGPSSAMAAFFRALIGNRGVKQAFYDPLGSIFGGVLNSYREGGHSDHVHVATYDRGGWLMPGLTLAQNNTGRPERVLAGGDAAVINVYVAGSVTTERDLANTIRNEIIRAGKTNGGGMFGNQA